MHALRELLVGSLALRVVLLVGVFFALTSGLLRLWHRSRRGRHVRDMHRRVRDYIQLVK